MSPALPRAKWQPMTQPRTLQYHYMHEFTKLSIKCRTNSIRWMLVPKICIRPTCSLDVVVERRLVGLAWVVGIGVAWVVAWRLVAGILVGHWLGLDSGVVWHLVTRLVDRCRLWNIWRPDYPCLVIILALVPPPASHVILYQVNNQVNIITVSYSLQVPLSPV